MSARNVLVERVLQSLDAPDGGERLAELLTDGFIADGLPREFTLDRAGFARYQAMIHAAFPDARSEVHTVIVDDRNIAIRRTLHGAHRGTWIRVAPSGRTVAIPMTEFLRIEGGAITHWSVLVDSFGMFVQMGALGGPPLDPVRLALFEIPVNDLGRSCAFYTRLLAPLGYELLAEEHGTADRGAAVGFGVPGEGVRPEFWLRVGSLGERRVHLAFRCKSTAAVDAFHAEGLAAGGKDQGRPGPRSFMPPNYYGAFVLDPDQHEMEGVCWR